MSFFEALEDAEHVPGLGRASIKIQPFVTLIHELRLRLADMSLEELIEEILDRTGYSQELKDEDTDEGKGASENIDEFISKAVSYEEGRRTSVFEWISGGSSAGGRY